MSNPLLLGKDFFDLSLAINAAAKTSLVAAGSGDNVQVVGLTIDRENLTVNGTIATYTNLVPIGVVFELLYDATLQATQTLSISAVEVDHSPDGTTWTTFLTQASAVKPTNWQPAGVVDTGAGGGSTQRGVARYGLDIKGAQRYIRIKFTPDLSASGTDVAEIMVCATFTGFDELPPGAV